MPMLEEQLWCYLTHSWENKEVHTFPKGICLKVNVIAQLEFELAYSDSALLTITPRGPPPANKWALAHFENVTKKLVI